MNESRSWWRVLLAEVLASAAGGLVVAGVARLLTTAMPALADAVAPLWVLAAVAVSVGLIVFFVFRHIGRAGPQVFVMFCAAVRTNWLAGLLDHLIWTLDRHGVDVVMKLPPYDYSGQSQIQQLSRLRRRRRSYMGGLMVVARLEAQPGLLTSFCRSARLPVVFMDVRPFASEAAYPPRSAFVGCDASQIGDRAAQWVVRQMRERGISDPVILVVGGEAQQDRHTRFQARVRELLPAAEVMVNPEGQYSRERARHIVDQQLRQLRSHGGMVDVIFCTNDLMALGALDAVQQHADAGNSHDHLIILGVDGTEEAVAAIDSGSPFKATIVQDARRVAESAVDLFLKLRAGQDVPTETWIPTTVYPYTSEQPAPAARARRPADQPGNRIHPPA